MSQIVASKSYSNHIPLKDAVRDYIGYLKPFIHRINRWSDMPTFIALKTIEYCIYKWYEPENDSWQNYKYELIFQITNRCTDRCPKCGIWKKVERSRISINCVLKCISDLEDNLYRVTITGGEPLLYMDDVIKIAHKTTNLEIPMTVVSNGYLITEDFLREMRKLKRNLIISVDTMDERKWSQYRGRDHFYTVMGNLRKSIDILGEYLSIQSVIAQETVEEIPVIAGFCTTNCILHNIQEYQDFGGIWHSAVPGGMIDSNLPCSAWLNISILPDGNIVKCFDYKRIPEARTPLGNLQSKSIKEILGSKRCDEITKIMRRCNLPCKTLRCNRK